MNWWSLETYSLLKVIWEAPFCMFLWGPQPRGEAPVGSLFHCVQELCGIGERQPLERILSLAPATPRLVCAMKREAKASASPDTCGGT